MRPIHRLAHLAQRPDGSTEWACPQCGRYLIRYPDTQLVVAAGAPGPARILAAIAAIGVLVGCGPDRPAGMGAAEQG
jgi:hypothetical protein